MSKSLLEELLIQAGTLNEETEKRVNTNQKTIIESTMANAVKNFIQEAVEGSEEELEGMEGEMFEMNVPEDQKAQAEDIFEEEDIDAETGEAVEGEDEEIDVEIEDDEDMEDMEDDEEIEIEDDEDMEDMEDDEEIEIEDDEDMEDEGMYDEESDEDDEYMDDTTDFEDEEEVLDMTNASLEEVMDFIENSEDEVVVKIVKKPTYSVSVENMSDDTEIEVDEDMLAEVISQQIEEEMIDVIDPAKEGSKIPDLMKAKKEFGIKNSETGQITMVKEENRKLKNQLAQLKEENRNLKLNETKSVAALKTMMEQSKKLALVNSNLAYVSRLFTEHVTTKQEKVEILKAFDSAKTINESQKRFKVLNESLSTRTQKKKINVNIKESVDFNQQKVIKEEKAFVEDPAQASILRLMNYKSQL
jgi:hypothetical protein